MTASPKLKASTPNLQDVSDLQKMLANLQEAHEAVIDQNSRLEAERTELRNKIETLEEEVRNHKSDATTAWGEVEELQQELGDLKVSLSDRAIDIPALVQARELIRKGDHRGGARRNRAHPRSLQQLLALRRLQCRGA